MLEAVNEFLKAEYVSSYLFSGLEKRQKHPIRLLDKLRVKFLSCTSVKCAKK